MPRTRQGRRDHCYQLRGNMETQGNAPRTSSYSFYPPGYLYPRHLSECAPGSFLEQEVRPGRSELEGPSLQQPCLVVVESTLVTR